MLLFPSSARPQPTSADEHWRVIIGAEELRTSGKATIAEVLRSTSASAGNTNNETQNSGWASAAGIVCGG